MKQRIVIRLHLAVRAVLQSEADWRGTRLGTLTSELIHEQAAKARLCGVQNYELNPVSSRYVPVTNGTKYKQTSGLEQISIYLNDEDMQTLKELALANDSVRVINGRQAITYRCCSRNAAERPGVYGADRAEQHGRVSTSKS